MNSKLYYKVIDNTLVFYDNKHDVIKFRDDEPVADNYSDERLAKVAPYKTDIQITTKCNQKCINCFLRTGSYKPDLDMSYATIKRNISKRENNKIRILITGGEPFLHPDIEKILGLPGIFKRLNFVICSNGSNIDNSYISLLHDYDWLVILSIHGGMATHNKYTQSNNYIKLVQTLESLSITHVRTKIYSVINEYSIIGDINHLLDLKDKYKVGAIKFFTPRSPGMSTVRYDERVLNYIRTHLNADLGLQKASSKTELITAGNIVTVTD